MRLNLSLDRKADARQWADAPGAIAISNRNIRKPAGLGSEPAIERPRCSRCQTRMMLERVSSGPIGFEHRLFECRRTQSTELRGQIQCSTHKTKVRNAPLAVL
jgi:hypothetical protein